MKRILIISISLGLVAGIGLLSACKKTNEYPSHLAIVSFPVITLLGPQDTTINRGATWKDPGATWKDTVTGESGTLKATAVNTSVDSAYMLLYTAVNKNGFTTYATRGLGVTNYNGPIDISGGYTNSNTGGYDSIYKVSRALFYNPDVDATTNFFSLYNGDPGVIVIKSDSTISVSTVWGEPTGTTGVLIPVTFSQASMVYQSPTYYTGMPPRLTEQPPVILSYTVTILNVPPYQLTFTHDLE